MACRLITSIYGLRQSPWAWYGKINTSFIDLGFHWSKCDHHMYIHSLFKLILLLYVDDLVITAPRLEQVDWIRGLLHQEFDITDLVSLILFGEWTLYKPYSTKPLAVPEAEHRRHSPPVSNVNRGNSAYPF